MINKIRFIYEEKDNPIREYLRVFKELFLHVNLRIPKALQIIVVNKKWYDIVILRSWKWFCFGFFLFDNIS